MLNINENQVKDSGYAAAIIFLICSLFFGQSFILLTLNL